MANPKRVATGIRRRSELSLPRMVLGTLVASGFIATALIAPNAVQLFAPYVKKKKPLFMQESRIRRTLADLKKRDLVATRADGSWGATAKGKRAALLAEGRESIVRKRWDGKWRVVMFDIAERKRGTRDRLREHLLQAGFVRLRRSAWILPWECSDYIRAVSEDLALSKTELLTLTVERFSDDERFVKEFKLSNR